MTDKLEQAYTMAQTGCVLIDRNDVARIWSTGEHRIDLIHRMSTNDLTGMVENEGRATVLTNAHGRIVDYIVVLHLGERALLLGSPGLATEVRRWLSGYIFFQDDMTLTDATEALGQFGLYGARADAVAEALASGASELPLHHAVAVGEELVVRGPALAGGGFEVIAPRAEIGMWVERATKAGARPAPATLYDVLRIEAGLPGAGHEISADYIPLEVGLWEAVSFSKGCYIGQEIIARMESRGQLAKTLVGLRAESALPIGAQLKAGDGSRGVVTSSIQSPQLGWLALGLIKPDAAAPGTPVSVHQNGETLTATVAELPFC